MEFSQIFLGICSHSLFFRHSDPLQTKVTCPRADLCCWNTWWGPGAKSRSWGPLLDAPAIDGISWENIMNKWFHIQDYLIMLKTYWCLLMNYLHSVLIWHLQMVANTFFYYINTCPPKLGISASLTGWNDPATTDDPSFYTHMFQVFSAITPEMIPNMTPM
jgi:hypothetical protein